MINSKITTIKLLMTGFLLIGCDGEHIEMQPELEKEEITPRDANDYGPGCVYTWPLIYNTDHIDTPAECVMKSSVCIHQQVQHCNDDPTNCYKGWSHCVDWYGMCLKETLP